MILTYSYTGNRLNSVTDTSTNYSGYPDTSGNPISYDDNGNMKDHIDKGVLQIDYNFLDLPKYIKFNEFVTGRKNKIYVNTTYNYRADGVKIRKVHNYKDPLSSDMLGYKVTDYLDGFQYEYDWNPFSGIPTSDLQLRFVPTAEGYYNFENNKYIYSYTDHLGNVRLSYTKNGSGGTEIIEENNFYPFGMKHEGYNALAGNPSYNYGYNGKELQKETGFSDYGWRQYQSDIGRWFGMDQLSEAYSSFSPYAYVGNNPIMRTDPDGRKWITNDMQAMQAEYNTWLNNGGGGGFASYFAGGGRGFSSEMNAYFGTGNAMQGNAPDVLVAKYSVDFQRYIFFKLNEI